MAVSCFSAASVQASEPSNRLCDYISQQELGGAAYAKGFSYSVDNAADFVTLIRTGYDVSEFKDAFVKSVKDNLDANGGKIIPNTNAESLGVYGAVIIALRSFGYDTSNFNGYNLDSILETIDIASARPAQYHYKYAVEVASPDRAKALIDDLIANYYTLGQGMDNWGFSCDNTAHFLVTIAPYASDYAAYVTDAKAIIKNHTAATGAFYSQTYNDPNADSTAVAMAAYASVGDIDETMALYKCLNIYYQSTKPGVMLYYGDENKYATADAMFGFYYAKKLFLAKNYQIADDVCLPSFGSHKVVDDAAVPATFKAAGKTAGSHCSVCGMAIVEQKAIAKLVSPKLKLKKGKKKFTATWTKAAGVDGYQLQYSLKKNFKKAKKKTLKKNKLTVKKLKSKKTYYVRVRAYKKINGKNVYSDWSTKKVKVK